MTSASGQGDLRADERDGRGGAEGGGAFGVDEFGGGEKDEEEAGGDDGVHPHLFAALGPLGAAAVGWCGVGAEGCCGAALEFEKHHEAGEGEHGNEEEEIVADDGADEAHLGGAGGEDAVFAELVQAADDELEGDEVEDDGGDAEEALQVDLDAAANEEDSEDDGDGDAEEGSGEAEELGGVESDGREDEDGLDAFAEDEQEDEEEEAELRAERLGDTREAGVLGNLLLRCRPSWSGRRGA